MSAHFVDVSQQPSGRAVPAMRATWPAFGSERDVAARAGLTRRQARLQLTGLADLAVVSCDPPPQWRLTDKGRSLLAGEA